MSPRHQSPPAALVRRRKLYTLIVFALPLTFFALLEASLRLVGYGGDLDLVVRKTVGRTEFYAINRSVARRYFTQSGITVPEPADDTFAIVKSSDTIRIFCIGESTMAGFPYEFNASAPSFLRERLKMMYPDKTIEIVNAGLSAVGSFVVLDFIRELIDYEPDLFIVYVGHNEFYGAYGRGSAVTVRGGVWVTRVTLFLLRFRTVHALRDLLGSVTSLVSSPVPASTATLMGQMAMQKAIRYGSPEYLEARSVFRENLRSIIETARSHGVPIVISSLVSNIKDLHPFVSLFNETADDHTKESWRGLVSQGDSALDRHHYAEAIAAFGRAIAVDSSNAEAFYGIGKAYYDSARYETARRDLDRAKDLDALRFRASEDFSAVLAATCASLQVPLARVDSAFRSASPHGIIGNELILEHLHPNIQGYFLMAKVWAQLIVERGLIGPVPASRSITDSLVMEQSMVTAFDSIYGDIKIRLLTHRWPFVGSDVSYRYIPEGPVETTIYRYVEGKSSWSDTRYTLAEIYARQRRFDLARRECLAVSKVIPFSFQPLLRVADYYREEGDRRAARKAYTECVATEDNPYARMKLAILSLEEEHAADAEQEIRRAFEAEVHSGYALPLQAKASGRYLLGVALAKQGNIAAARRELEHALLINPSHQEARTLLRELPE